MMEKTYKRELATLMVLFLMGLTVGWVFFDFMHAQAALEILIIPFMTFVGLAFGAEAYAKQIIPAQKVGK